LALGAPRAAINETGLSQSTLGLIRGVFKRHPNVTAVILFGSRAKGTASPASDVDLALEGHLDALQVEAIRSELDELTLPYRFDVVGLELVRLDSLREHIERVGVRIYG